MDALELNMDSSSIYKCKACSYGSTRRHCINSVLHLVLSMNTAYDLRIENRRQLSHIQVIYMAKTALVLFPSRAVRYSPCLQQFHHC